MNKKSFPTNTKETCEIIEKNINKKNKKTLLQEGWICPVCGCGNSPYNYGSCQRCSSNQKIEWTC